MKFLTFALSLILINSYVAPIFAAALTEDQKIEALLKTIETSNAVFIRNGEDHPSKEAAEHLRSKLDSARKSLFAPKRSSWTAKMFINKIASKSSLSGKDYFIRLPSKRLCQAGVWLHEQLALIEAAK